MIARHAAKLSELLRTYSPEVVARGRDYAAEGRVSDLRRDAENVTAFVRGRDKYHVWIGLSRSGALIAQCTCPAHAIERECKHLAAVAWVSSKTDARGRPMAAPRKQPIEPLPEVLRGVYAATAFFARLSLYAGERLGVDVPQWVPLVDWWRDARSEADVALRHKVVVYAATIARELESLRRWVPPLPSSQPTGSPFEALYARLVSKFLALRDKMKLGKVLPGPLEGSGHPGFALRYSVSTRVFEVVERAAPLLARPERLAFAVPLGDVRDIRFVDDTVSEWDRAEAWSLVALREVIVAMHARTDEAVLELERDLARPAWDHMLEQLNVAAQKPPAPREWAFVLRVGALDDLRLALYSRGETKTGKVTKWRSMRLDALLDGATMPLERDIARAAAGPQVFGTPDAAMRLGTAHAHEVLRLLALHPRVQLSTERKPDTATDPRAVIIVGDVTMRMDRAPNGALAPRFVVGTKELAPAMLMDRAGVYRFAGLLRGDTVVSAFVPSALAPWVLAAEQMRGSLAFPPEAMTRLVAVAAPLVAAGVAELPRDALGAELAYDPRPALRIEWRVEGAAVVHLFIAACDGAPLIAAGLGPELFTFERGGQRVFVQRELGRELSILDEARGQIAVPLLWTGDTGRTESLETALLLADYLDRNPLGLTIEVAVGRRPTVTTWVESSRALEVRREGSWLVLGGTLQVGSVKLTLGDVLEAARLARRYVPAADGVFLELSKEAIARLQPVAMAAELGQAKRGEGQGDADDVVQLHHAFGSILAEAQSLFSTVSGTDLEPYVKRFETRRRKVKVPKLERGVLRPYQRDGVAWMLHLATWAPGCILADDMGLGKTVQGAALLKARASLGPALIVAPASVTSNWVVELARFMPSLAVTWFNDEREVTPAALGPNDVLVVSYGLLQRNEGLFRAQHWATVLIDEAQYVKNIAALRTDAIRSLTRDFTVALTGTPLENHLGELFSITDVVFPRLLGTDALFRERFRRPIEGAHDATRLAVLGRLLEPFLLRRTRAKVLDDLPPREEITETIELGPEEKKRYLALRRACELQFAKRKKAETSAQMRIAIFAALTRLRQLACDVSLVDPTYEGASTKILRTVELCTELAAGGNRALVFSSFTTFLGRIRDALTAAGLRVAYLAGDTPTTSRRPLIDAFQAGEYDVFCVSLLAGGTGLNLTKASYVIHTDPWWNPASEEQATSRAHRIGQSDPVTVYRLVARGTIEEAVLEMHASKKELAAAVLEGKASTKAITSDELLELIRFGGS